MRYLLYFFLPCSLIALQNFFQLRGGCFHLSNSAAREIYGPVLADIEAENALQNCTRFSTWINLNYTTKKGHTAQLSSPTRLHLGTLSLGPKAFFHLKSPRAQFYLGLGASGAYVHIQDTTNYLPPKTIRWSLGCVGKSGFLLQCTESLFFDLFCDYYYQPTKTRKSSSLTQSSIDLGGVRAGLGIGYRFPVLKKKSPVSPCE